MKCEFRYSDGYTCNEERDLSDVDRSQTTIVHNEKRIDAWHPHFTHRYCHYHRKVMSGMCDTVVGMLYGKEVQKKILDVREAYEQTFVDKKRKEIHKWIEKRSSSNWKDQLARLEVTGTKRKGVVRLQ